MSRPIRIGSEGFVLFDKGQILGLRIFPPIEDDRAGYFSILLQSRLDLRVLSSLTRVRFEDFEYLLRPKMVVQVILASSLIEVRSEGFVLSD